MVISANALLSVTVGSPASDHRQGSGVWSRSLVQPNPATSHVTYTGGPGAPSAGQSYWPHSLQTRWFGAPICAQGMFSVFKMSALSFCSAWKEVTCVFLSPSPDPGGYWAPADWWGLLCQSRRKRDHLKLGKGDYPACSARCEPFSPVRPIRGQIRASCSLEENQHES